MTTVIADTSRGILVADSLVTTYNALTQYKTEKLFRAGKSIFGGAGDVMAGLRFQRWQQDGGAKKDRPKFTEADDHIILELASDGLWMWDWTMARERISDAIYAVGSGSKVALYCAWVLKLPAEQCIEEAAKVDVHTALPVQVMVLEEK